MNMSHQFPKASRLLNAGDYSCVFDNSTLRASASAGTVLSVSTARDTSRLGVIVAKKNIRLACQRNRVKRLVREYFRKHHLPNSMDLVFMARRGASELSNDELTRDLDRIWRKLDRASRGL